MTTTTMASPVPPWANAARPAIPPAMMGPTSGMISRTPVSDPDGEGVGDVEDRPEDDVGDRRHEGDEEDLPAQPRAQDDVDPAEDLLGPRADLGTEEPEGERAHPLAVEQEVERHDDRQEGVEQQVPQLRRDVQRVAR